MTPNDALIEKFVPLEVYRFPLRPKILLFLVVFTLWFSYIVSTIIFIGLTGAVVNIGMAYTGLSFFIGYMFIITEFTAQGYQHIPAISGTIFTTEKPRLFKLIFLVLALISLFLFIKSTTGQFVFLCFCMLIFPIATSILVWEASLISMLNPAKWLGVLIGIASDPNCIRYLGLQVLAIGLGYITLTGGAGYWLPASMFCLLLVWTLMFRLLGVILHTNADALGISVTFGEQVEQAQREKANSREINAFTSELYSLYRSGAGKQALSLLQQKLKASAYRDEHEYFQRICKWEDPGFALVSGQKYLERLTDNQDFRQAFEVLEFCYNANQQKYVVRPASTVFALFTHAETRLQKTIVTHLLEHFDQDFPRHPRISEALLLAAQTAAHELDDWPRARHSLARLRKIDPRITTQKSYRTLVKLVSE